MGTRSRTCLLPSERPSGLFGNFPKNRSSAWAFRDCLHFPQTRKPPLTRTSRPKAPSAQSSGPARCKLLRGSWKLFQECVYMSREAAWPDCLGMDGRMSHPAWVARGQSSTSANTQEQEAHLMGTRTCRRRKQAALNTCLVTLTAGWLGPRRRVHSCVGACWATGTTSSETGIRTSTPALTSVAQLGGVIL